MILGASLIALSTASAGSVPQKKGPPHVVKVVKVVGVTNNANSAPDFGAMIAMVDKMFPPQPDPDPARLALARTSSAAMWPQGAYGNIMTGMMGTIYDRVMQLKPSDFDGAHGGKPAAAGDTDEPSIHDAAVTHDPYFDQRSAAVRQVLTEEAAEISAILDPRIRDGLARAMARRFDQQQLADINAFFATPSGHALANQYMQLWIDPDMIRSMVSTMPEMMKLMPNAMQKVKAAADKFPAPGGSAKAAPAHAKS